MTDAQKELQTIGYRVYDCAGLALGIDLLVIERHGIDNERFERAISGMASVLETELKRLSYEIDGWLIDHAKGLSAPVKPQG